MISNRFQTFDPFMSFDKSGHGFREKVFLKADGKSATPARYEESRDRSAYLSSLWRMGREAYATLGEKYGDELTTDFFEANLAAIKELERSLIPAIQGFVDGGSLTLRARGDYDAVEDVTQLLDEGSRGTVAEVFMRCLIPLVIAGEIAGDEVADFEGVFLTIAISNIDDCLVANHIGHDASGALELVMSNIASATLYRETIDAAKGALSAAARRSAEARHRSNSQQRAAALADWEAEGHNFSSMRAFARECYKRYEVKDFTTVYNWVREHRKNKV